MTKRALLITIAALLLLMGGIVWYRLAFSSPLDDIVRQERRGALFMVGNQPPPTNKWFSSLAFKQPSDPVFAYPLSLKTTQHGLALSYPQVRASTHTISAPFQPDVELNFGESIKTYITEYDDLSVTLELRKDATKIAQAHISQGSPYIFLRVEPRQELLLNRTISLDQNGDADLNDVPFALYASSAIKSEVKKLHTNEQAADIAVYVKPENADSAALKKGARHPITRTEVEYKVDKTVETTFIYETADGTPTPVALLSEHRPTSNLGTYKTLLGQQILTPISRHTFSSPLVDLKDNLPVSQLTQAERQQLVESLKSDVGKATFTKNDSYFSGKEFYKIANLLELAEQLEMKDEATALKAGLSEGLNKWFANGETGKADGTYFYYDEHLKGIVGVPASFGSEEFNDHHFHYGYFIYAAATLAKYDPAFLDKHQRVVAALVADIASTERNTVSFPYLRVFDQYAGHSWASGFAPFADGNNQESSSEAAAAWHALAKWAKVTKDTSLTQTASWLYARETQAAKQYYLAFDRSRPELQGYEHTIVSILWSGKLDYATFFDASPEAKLAIQLLPISPAATYLYEDSGRARQNYEAMVNERGGPPILFKDYLAMYQATFDYTAGLAAANRLTDAEIDGANSRTYMLAWIFTRN